VLRSTSDGLGRLIELDEPNSATASVTACPQRSDPIVATTYAYDGLNSLTGVVQNGSRQGTFFYDSVSCLLASYNPESNSGTGTQAADEYNQRKAREAILRGILGSLFARKEAQRGFTPEQRRLIWNAAGSSRRTSCGKVLSCVNFTLDHIDPHSKGGPLAFKQRWIDVPFL
jgi:hypothetical protein